MAFITAFEAGDTDAMRDAFAENATSFPRTVSDHSDDLDRFRRSAGIDPEMLAVVEVAKGDSAEPPYLSIEPKDLEIHVAGDMALVTFHLVADGELGRRTFVMSRMDGDWKILHVHASNVVVANSQKRSVDVGSSP